MLQWLRHATLIVWHGTSPQYSNCCPLNDRCNKANGMAWSVDCLLLNSLKKLNQLKTSIFEATDNSFAVSINWKLAERTSTRTSESRRRKRNHSADRCEGVNVHQICNATTNEQKYRFHSRFKLFVADLVSVFSHFSLLFVDRCCGLATKYVAAFTSAHTYTIAHLVVKEWQVYTTHTSHRQLLYWM